MKLVNLIEEDFTNYREPGMFLGFPFCSGKCNHECGQIICQNQALHDAESIDISAEEIIERYKNNPITKCLILGGLEPFDSMEDLTDIVWKWCIEFYQPGLRDIAYGKDPIIIYTGYYPFELEEKLRAIAEIQLRYPHPVFIKYGRYIPGHKKHHDPILGVDLASDNQYGESFGGTVFKFAYDSIQGDRD